MNDTRPRYYVKFLIGSESHFLSQSIIRLIRPSVSTAGHRHPVHLTTPFCHQLLSFSRIKQLYKTTPGTHAHGLRSASILFTYWGSCCWQSLGGGRSDRASDPVSLIPGLDKLIRWSRRLDVDINCYRFNLIYMTLGMSGIGFSWSHRVGNKIKET